MSEESNPRKFGQPVKACYKKYMDVIPDDGSVVQRIYHMRFPRKTTMDEVCRGARHNMIRFDHVAIAVLADCSIIWTNSRCNWTDQYSKRKGFLSTVGPLIKKIALGVKGNKVINFDQESFTLAKEEKYIKEWLTDLIDTISFGYGIHEYGIQLTPMDDWKK